MSEFMSDADVVARALEHIENKTTDRSDDVWREPVENYRKPERFAQELALFKTLPIPDVDEMETRLAEVTVIETKGIIFVIQQKPSASRTDAIKLLDKLPDVIKADQIIFAETEMIVEANWKLHLESFLEGYHIKPAHKTTFFPYGYDNVNVVEFSGPHSRVTFPFRRIEALKDVSLEDHKLSNELTYVNHLFPNVFSPLVRLSRPLFIFIKKCCNDSHGRNFANTVTVQTPCLSRSVAYLPAHVSDY